MHVSLNIKFEYLDGRIAVFSDPIINSNDLNLFDLLDHGSFRINFA